MKTKLWGERLNSLKEVKSNNWTIKDLDKVIKSLKKNQTTDPSGMISELFLPGIMGSDLQSGVISLINGIKNTRYFPKFMEMADICTIYKNKGSRLEMKNERGIFILPILRKILDKLTYQDKYDGIADGMSDSNIGAQKKKNIKNHLFVVLGVINAVLKEGGSCIDIQIYDLVQAFDGLWLADCMNDLYDSIPVDQRDDKLALMYEANVNTTMAVNTAMGQTDRVSIRETVQQGVVFGPIMCSNSIDKIGKKCYERGENLYLYKQRVNILPLGMVDDLLGISSCGQSSVSLNTYINTQIELKKLRFHTPDKEGKTKCHKLHIGTKNKLCPELKVHGTTMKEVSHDVYLGHTISSDGKNEKNLKNRVGKGIGITSEIMNILEKVTFGEHYFSIAILLRESLFLNSVLSSCEVWYGMSRADIKQLEDVDLSLLRKVLNAPISVPAEAIYLELGILDIESIIKARRANYLHYLATRDKNEMLYKFFITQWQHSTVGDWTIQARLDLADFGITDDLSWIRKQSKHTFKKLVKARSKQFALFKFLEKKESHSKLKDLWYCELKLQDYLKLETMTAFEAKTVFSYRTRAAQYSDNYRGTNGLSPCPLCLLHLDCQAMAFQCQVIRESVHITECYDRVFNSSISNTLAKTLVKIDNTRSDILRRKALV